MPFLVDESLEVFQLPSLANSNNCCQFAKETTSYLYDTRLSRQEYHSESTVIKGMTENLWRTRVERINVDEIQLCRVRSIGEEWVKHFIDR